MVRTVGDYRLMAGREDVEIMVLHQQDFFTDRQE
jgi:hypothetical protein